MLSHTSVTSAHKFRTSLFTTAMLCASFALYAQTKVDTPATPAAGEWTLSTQGTGRSFAFSAPPSSPGKPAPFSARFVGDPHSDKHSKGVVGVEIFIHDLARYKGFDFDAFEGPDAPAAAKKLVIFTISAKGKAAVKMRFAAAGWYPQSDSFAFGMVEVSGKPGTPQKALLRELAADAESVQVTIVDFRDAARTIELLVPVHSQGANFARLLEGMNR